jgi:hypothetical protein
MNIILRSRENSSSSVPSIVISPAESTSSSSESRSIGESLGKNSFGQNEIIIETHIWKKIAPIKEKKGKIIKL